MPTNAEHLQESTKTGEQTGRNDLYERLGVTPVINACGVYTGLGGSILSPAVWAAMEESNRTFVSMVELLDRSGEILAEIAGAEAARVTPGASAAITLGTAACMTGVDGQKWEQLPDTTGMPDRIIIQRGHHYMYDRCARMTGATLHQVGDEHGTTPAQLEAAFDESAAVVVFPAHLDGAAGTLPLAEVAALSRSHDVPTLVDAAYLVDSAEIIRSFSAAGADLVCFSAKYFGGPNSGGFICGRKDLIDAVAGLDFTRFESGDYRTFGRPFKLDRQVIVGVVVALQEWMSIEPAQRWAGYAEKVDRLLERARLNEIEGVTVQPRYFTMEENLLERPVNCVALAFDAGSDHTAHTVSDALLTGKPSIAAMVHEESLVVAVDVMLPGQELIVADRLNEILAPPA
ncbi:MAG: aminotransferase class V-fold PLP-dependent enzyme [Acidobacteria bacterium]|nr:aminotransferase class V-fold PLP-dependent enzyme [Acidobacteriota bacterium]